MIQEVKMYNAKCDECGIEAEFGDFTCYGDKDAVRTDVDVQGWEVTNDDHCYCDECISKRNGILIMNQENKPETPKTL